MRVGTATDQDFTRPSLPLNLPIGEPQCLQSAVSYDPKNEGCLGVALGQWVCVLFIGANRDLGWCYGEDVSHTRGWFPLEVLSGWVPVRPSAANLELGEAPDLTL